MNFCSHRVESAQVGHYRLSQETDEQTKVFAVVSKRKDEVRTNKVPGKHELLRLVVAVIDSGDAVCHIICYFFSHVSAVLIGKHFFFFFLEQNKGVIFFLGA